MEERKILHLQIRGTNIVLTNVSDGYLTDVCMKIERNDDLSWILDSNLPEHINMDPDEEIILRTLGVKGTEDTTYATIEAKYDGKVFKPRKPLKITIQHK